MGYFDMQNIFVKLNNINHKSYCAILYKWYMDGNFILSFTLKTEFAY